MRPFLYTLDQLATLLSMDEVNIKARHCHFEGRSPGARPLDKLLTRNLAADGDTPEWRVAEHEFIRWMRRKGFRFHERGWATD